MTDDARASHFETLYRRHVLAVYRYVYRRVDRSDVDDLVAEVFAVAWDKWADAEARGLPWLYRTASFAVANHRRAVARRPRPLPVLPEDERHAVPGQESEVQDRMQIRDLLSGLSDDDIELVSLLFWEELSIQDAAAVVGCSVSAAYVRVHRLRRRLRVSARSKGYPTPGKGSGA